jgi:hypothetical protein
MYLEQQTRQIVEGGQKLTQNHLDHRVILVGNQIRLLDGA